MGALVAAIGLSRWLKPAPTQPATPTTGGLVALAESSPSLDHVTGSMHDCWADIRQHYDPHADAFMAFGEHAMQYVSYDAELDGPLHLSRSAHGVVAGIPVPRETE